MQNGFGFDVPNDSDILSYMRSRNSIIIFLFIYLIHVDVLWAKRNVLMILVDDLKPAIGCYGDKLAITPNIDKLASKGVKFDMAYCNQAVCAPSRNNLLLGSRSTSLGIYGLGTPFRKAIPDAISLPQYFRSHGYSAEAVGKILHFGHGNTGDPESWSRPPIREKVVEYLKPVSTNGGQLTREEAFFSNQRLGNIRSLPRGAAWESAKVDDEAYSDGRIAAEGIKRLRNAAKNPDKPFFLALGFVKPHLPFTAPKKYWDMHDPDKFELAVFQQHPKNAPVYAGKRGGEIVNYSPLSIDNLKTDKIQRKLLHGYYATTTYADAQIGKVMDALDDLGLSQNTIVVLWGDHGWHLGDHGYWTKHTNYEQSNRIPLLFVAPGIAQQGVATKQLAETVDIYPTLAELAGLPKPQCPQPVDGKSLVPVLKAPDKRIGDHVYHCYPRGNKMGRAIRTQRYRLIQWFHMNDPKADFDYELYDYQNDPLEKVNIAKSNTKILNELLNLLKKHPEPKKRIR